MEVPAESGRNGRGAPSRSAIFSWSSVEWVVVVTVRGDWAATADQSALSIAADC